MKKEESIGTKEKMIKSCKLFSNIILVLECIVLIGVLLLGIFGIALGIAIATSEVNENQYETQNSVEENSNETIIETENLYINENDTLDTVKEFIRVICSVVILDIIRRILKNTAKDETPFSNNNLKRIKIIGICMAICLICAQSLISIEIIYLILISSIYLIFKYGYELQRESDETL